MQETDRGGPRSKYKITCGQGGWGAPAAHSAHGMLGCRQQLAGPWRSQPGRQPPAVPTPLCRWRDWRPGQARRRPHHSNVPPSWRACAPRGRRCSRRPRRRRCSPVPVDKGCSSRASRRRGGPGSSLWGRAGGGGRAGCSVMRLWLGYGYLREDGDKRRFFGSSGPLPANRRYSLEWERHHRGASVPPIPIPVDVWWRKAVRLDSD